MLRDGFIKGSSAIATHGLSGGLETMLAQMLLGIMFFEIRLVTKSSPNNACRRTWWWAVQNREVQAKAISRFVGLFSHQAANASRWVHKHYVSFGKLVRLANTGILHSYQIICHAKLHFETPY